MNLTSEQSRVHARAKRLSKTHRDVEAALVRTLQEVEKLKIHRRLGRQSVFRYACEILGLSEALAYALISVGRKSLEIPELQVAIERGSLSLSKAARIVSCLTIENAAELIAYAQTHSKREIEREIAKRNPKSAHPDQVKPIDSELFGVRVCVSKLTLEKLQRVQSLLAQKNQKTDWDSLLNSVADQFLERHDPVRKAERAQRRKRKSGAGAGPGDKSFGI